MPGVNDYDDLLDKLGKHKASINKLSDINEDVLEQLIQRSYNDAKRTLL